MTDRFWNWLIVVLFIIVAILSITLIAQPARAQDLAPVSTDGLPAQEKELTRDMRLQALKIRALTVGIEYVICERNWRPFWHRVYWREPDGWHYISLPYPWNPVITRFALNPCKRAMRMGGACSWQLGSDWETAKHKLGCPRTVAAR